MSQQTHTAWRQLQERVRGFNKWLLNPLTLRFAGRPFSPYALVRHVGRRSGRIYHTPVVIAQTGEHDIIPLPYGAHVDWARNVLAADGCTVLWQGCAHRAGEPHIIEAIEGMPAFPGWVQLLLRWNARRTGHDQFLRLTRLAEDPTAYREITAQHPARSLVWSAVAALLLVLVAGMLSRRDWGE
jgi:deazaflavin-dependent oxidoreductase (nitroreductase family)